MPVKLVIFDLDGTLVDSLEDITVSLNHSLEPYGFEPLTREKVKGLIGGGISVVMGKILGKDKARLGREVTERFLRFYHEHIVDNTKVYPGVVETLERLKNEGCRLSVVSNKRAALSKRVLDELGLSRYFDKVIGSDSVGEKKPSPVPVLHLLSTFGVEPGEAVMVGDSELDIEAGRRAGVSTIAVTYGYRGADVLADADYIIDDVREIPETVRKISRNGS